MSETLPFLTGPERIEVFQPLGKPMRMGDLAALAVSDRARVEEALSAKDAARAMEYLMVVHTNQGFVNAGYGEWCLELTAAFGRCMPEGTPDLSAKVAAEWQQGVRSLETNDTAKRVLQGVAYFLGLAGTPAVTADEFRARMGQGDFTVIAPAMMDVEGSFQAVLAAVQQGDFAGAAGLYAAHWDATVAMHDSFAQYVTAFLTVVNREVGQAAAQQLIRESFSSLSFYAGMMGLSKMLPPPGAAAFLAEHLRGHLSGAKRDGQVDIVDAGDYYFLRVNPCGSGGAQRQRLQSALATFAEPSPFTWGRAGEVPLYCAHCALNEIALIQLIGFPALVTDFSTDATKPCGWRLYKDPSLIPQEFFARVAPAETPAG